MATTTWNQLREQNPDHSANYARRWEKLVAEGNDIDGEARLVDALAGRGARILDAGAGTGRTGAYLATRGHHVTGVDLDPDLVEYARQNYPDAEWHVGDLAGPRADLPEGDFDLVVSAGNVLAFIAPEDRRAALENLRAWVDGVDGGRIVVGFGLDRGWTYEQFAADCAAAGLAFQHRFGGWNVEPFDPGESGFLVAVLVPAPGLE